MDLPLVDDHDVIEVQPWPMLPPHLLVAAYWKKSPDLFAETFGAVEGSYKSVWEAIGKLVPDHPAVVAAQISEKRFVTTSVRIGCSCPAVSPP